MDAPTSPLMLSVSGCRGVLGGSMTPAVAARFSGAFAGVLRERGEGRPLVALGRDGRRGSEMVKAAAEAGLLASGCDVVDIGVAMTPTTAVMTDELARGRRAAGIMVTASHNPQEWCGLKCLLAEGGEFHSAACAPPEDVARAIIRRFEGTNPGTVGWNDMGRLERGAGAIELHVQRVLSAMEDAGLTWEEGSGARAAIDSVNASGVEAGRVFLEEAGCEEILQLGGDASGVFPHPPEPTAENLALEGGLCEAVRGAAFDIGFAQDPDGDRLAIIDERGVYVGEEYTLALGAWALLEARRLAGDASPAALVTNLSTSRMLNDVARRYGASVERTPVGEAHVVQAMKRLASEGKTVVCGGEGNGGLIWPRVAYVRDSLSAMGVVLWLMRHTGRRVSELVDMLPRYAIEKRKVALERRADAEPAVARIAAGYAGQRVDVRDGAWVDFITGPRAGKAWLHVRASNTEPIMRLIAEAPTQEEARLILDEGAALASA